MANGSKSVSVYIFAQTVGIRPRHKSTAQCICFCLQCSVSLAIGEGAVNIIAGYDARSGLFRSFREPCGLGENARRPHGWSVSSTGSNEARPSRSLAGQVHLRCTQTQSAWSQCRTCRDPSLPARRSVGFPCRCGSLLQRLDSRDMVLARQRVS